MSINKILLAMALGLALTACSNQEPAADAAAPAASLSLEPVSPVPATPPAR